LAHGFRGFNPWSLDPIVSGLGLRQNFIAEWVW
jgi:hypothetical protein